MLLENRVAIITGGARGMGGAIALKFAENGCSIAIADILDEVGEKTVKDIKKVGRDKTEQNLINSSTSRS